MDLTRCPRCKKPMKTVLKSDGRTDFLCLECDNLDPLITDAAKWANSPLASPAKDA
jgi:hypothetical protein